MTQGKWVGRRWRGSASMLLALLLTLPGCQKTYYTVLEKFGVEKRELLAKRVERAKDSQQEAQEEFRDALEKFQAVTGHTGGKLEDRYESLRLERDVEHLVREMQASIAESDRFIRQLE